MVPAWGSQSAPVALMRRIMRFGLPTILACLATLAACAPQQPPRPPGDVSPPPVAAPPSTSPQPAAPLPAAPAPRPAWVARSVVPDAVEIPSSTYVVKGGDTLRHISDRTGAASEAIARANNLSAPFLIRIGQRLTIPGGRWHKVKPGETGIAISRAYGVDWLKVVELNRLEEPYILRDGQKLLLPSRAEVAAMTLEERAAAFELDIDDLITGGEPAASEAAARRPSPPATPTRPLPPGQPVVESATAAPGQFSWPVSGAILSRFGPKPGGRYNDGINIRVTAGTPVRAAAEGSVAYAGNDIPGFGGLVLVKHGGGWITAYAHAEALLVQRGQAVKRGDIIARAGQTGSVDEPQVHFEIREGRKPVDPLKYLPAAR